MRKCHIREHSYSQDFYAKALDQSDRSIFQILQILTIFGHFWLKNNKLLYLLNHLTIFFFFCIYIEYHKMFKMMLSFSVKMPFCPDKGQKGAKVGGAVGQNQLFVYCSKLSH